MVPVRGPEKRLRGWPWEWVLAAAVLGAWVGGRLGRVEVRGGSMAPVLLPGDRVVVLRRGGPWRRPRPDDLVVLADPRDSARTVVKRLVALDAGGADVRGDNAAASTDSRVFGRVPAAALRGRAVYRYAPRKREGWLVGRP